MSRRLAVLACKHAIRSTLQADLQGDFKRDSETVREGVAYRLWSGINRASQNRMWSLLAEQTDADLPRIEACAETASRDSEGSLDLMPDRSDIPEYQYEKAIHGQPGGYMLDRNDQDLAAGVLYEAGGNIYALGQGIGKRDSKGERLIAYIREHYAALHPCRILEMGCSAGGKSTDYPRAFPEAEVHAIDLSPGMLRYAHARAELLDARIHFHQRDAGDTGFPTGHFDLIVSHNLFHEVAAAHMPAILEECYRLLAPGGICIHQDVPIQRDRLDDFGQFLSAWQTSNNDEPFWMDFADADMPAMLAAAGFEPHTINARYLQAIDGPIPWYVVTATR